MTRLRKALPFLLLACAAFTALPLAAQTPPDCSFTFNFTGASTQTAVSNLSNNTPCVNWRLTLSTTGTLSATVTFYTSPDNITFTAVPNTVCSSTVQPPCVLQGANPIVGTQGMLYSSSYGSYVRVVVTLPSGAGTGTVRAYGAKGASANAGSGGGLGPPLAPAGVSGDVQTNNGNGGLGVSGINCAVAGTCTLVDTVLPSGLSSPFSILSPVFAGGAKGNVRSVQDAAITAASSTLSSATAAFTTADTGKKVTVAMGAKSLTAATYTSGLTVTGNAGAQFTGTIATTTLTVTAITTGTILVGQTIQSPGGNNQITALGTGSGGIGTYTVGTSQTVALSAMGALPQTCTFTAFNGGGSAATATVYLTGNNAIAASTPLQITAPGTGYTSAPTTATVASGTATCTGTPVLAGVIMPAAVQATATYVSATQITLSTPATSTVSAVSMTIGTDDTAAIQAAVNAAQAVNGSLIIPDGTYQITSPIVISKGMRIQGQGIFPMYGSRFGNPLNSVMPTAAVPITGSILLMTAPNTDAIQVTAVGESVHFDSFGIRFDSSFAFLSTGHGINALPPNDSSALPDLGIFGPRWNNLAVWGTDGNHYAWELVNTQYMTVTGLQAWGGGCMDLYAHANWVNPGNNVFVHPYCYGFVGGSSHGYYVHLTTAGATQGNVLNAFLRPQSIQAPMPSVFSTWGIPSINMGQNVFNADGNSSFMSIEAPDFEVNAGSGESVGGALSQNGGFINQMFQAGGTQGILASNFFRVIAGQALLLNGSAPQDTIASLSSGGQIFYGQSNNLQILTTSPTRTWGGNQQLRLADSATSATRDEFTILHDITNVRTVFQSIHQGVANENFAFLGNHFLFGTVTDRGSSTLLQVAGAAQTTVTTVTGLGTCNAATEGSFWAVSDAVAPTFLVTLVGGGAVHSPAYCNGTNWVSH